MSHLRLILCRVEDDQPDKTTEIAAVDLPETKLDDFTKETCLDILEERTLQAGHALMRPLFEAQWNEVDTRLADVERRMGPILAQSGSAAPGNREALPLETG